MLESGGFFFEFPFCGCGFLPSLPTPPPPSDKEDYDNDDDIDLHRPPNSIQRAVVALSKDLNWPFEPLLRPARHDILHGLTYLQREANMKSSIFKWIYWTQPLTCCLEALMVNQRGVFIKCSDADLIPGIPSASIANQGFPFPSPATLNIGC